MNELADLSAFRKVSVECYYKQGELKPHQMSASGELSVEYFIRK